LLQELSRQEDGGLFSFSLVVVDNDREESARATVQAFAANAPFAINYHVEPRQNIALARNKAVANAEGEYIAFIDDDEFPCQSWLLTLFNTCQEFGVDGVLGSVRPYFEEPPPKWVVEGGFYKRYTYRTGTVIDWGKGRTGNVLLKRVAVRAVEPPFRPEFRSGEDQDFFRRVIEKGYVFVWCDEAVAYEIVPPSRWSRSFLCR
jgi:succinoglycan biosynthesis protein ExoM